MQSESALLLEGQDWIRNALTPRQLDLLPQGLDDQGRNHDRQHRTTEIQVW
jgi:hypothetical protein